MTESHASASCLCGLFTVSVTGSFGDVRYCHCSQCRRKSGTAFTANAKIDASQFELHGPRADVTEFEHKPGLFNAFCSRCGSPLYARSDANPEDMRVRLGGFDGDVDANVTAHVWVGSKSAWYNIQDDLPCFEEAWVEPDTSSRSN